MTDLKGANENNCFDDNQKNFNDNANANNDNIKYYGIIK